MTALANQVAVITGAGSGIGRAIAGVLAAQGATACLVGRTRKKLEETAANLTAPYDKTTLGDTQQSKDRFITEVYDEVKGLPPVVDGKRTPSL